MSPRAVDDIKRGDIIETGELQLKLNKYIHEASTSTGSTTTWPKWKTVLCLYVGGIQLCDDARDAIILFYWISICIN